MNKSANDNMMTRPRPQLGVFWQP